MVGNIGRRHERKDNLSSLHFPPNNFIALRVRCSEFLWSGKKWCKCFCRLGWFTYECVRVKH